MDSTLKIWETSRKLFLNFFENHTIKQLNKIPKGFNNNLIWNIGHVIVAQQALIYKSSGLQGYISNELMELYKPGTRPHRELSKNEVEELKHLMSFLIEKTETDFYNGKFTTFNEKMTGTGFYLTSIKDAFEFNNYHEGLHLGYMMNLRKLI